MNNPPRRNSAGSWILAARPKTLAGAATPVIMGGACALLQLQDLSSLNWTALLLCLGFAFLMQTDANFINDYLDFKKGGDTSKRLGPPRACAQGWISERAIRMGILLTTLAACATGLPLIYTGGPWMLAVGLVCVIFCFLYTTTFSRMGLGDLLVLVFFGLIPVGVTCFLQTGLWTTSETVAGLACGMAIDCLLLVNNHRDRTEDAMQGKKTLIVRLGGRAAVPLYYSAGILATALAATALLPFRPLQYTLCLLPYLLLHLQASHLLSKTDGEALNPLLGRTSLNFLILALGFALAAILPWTA